MYVNKHDTTKQCAIRGNEAEDIFEKWLIANNRKYRRATLQEQYQHIDFVIDSNDNFITVDVKAPKSVCRGGPIDSQILWVEFVNVRGNAGWLYGANDYIAFYNPSYIPKPNSLFYGTNLIDFFIVVKTNEFAKLCESLCNQGYTDNAKDALYKKYTRAGSHDVISMIRMQDIIDNGNYWEIAI